MPTVTVRYGWVEGARVGSGLDPQVVGESLEVIRVAGGSLTPASVLEHARDPESYLHKAFEWDDVVAAEAYRLDQARQLVREVVVVPEEAPEPVRAFVRIAEEPTYRSIAEVRDDADLQIAMRRAALRDLASWRRRYGNMLRYFGVDEHVNELQLRLEAE